MAVVYTLSHTSMAVFITLHDAHIRYFKFCLQNNPVVTPRCIIPVKETRLQSGDVSRFQGVRQSNPPSPQYIWKVPPGQWYPEGFHAKSMVLKRITPFITPSTAVSPCFTPPWPTVIVSLPPHSGMYSYSFSSIVWCSIIRCGNMFPSYATYLTRERTVRVFKVKNKNFE